MTVKRLSPSLGTDEPSGLWKGRGTLRDCPSENLGHRSEKRLGTQPDLVPLDGPPANIVPTETFRPVNHVNRPVSR